MNVDAFAKPTPTAWPSPAELVLFHRLPTESGDPAMVLDVLISVLEDETACREEAEAALDDVWVQAQDIYEAIESWKRTSWDLEMTLLEVVRRVHPEYRNGLPEDLLIDPGRELREVMNEVFRRFDAIGW